MSAAVDVAAPAAVASGNAVEHFLDRHLREGRAAAPAFVDPASSLTYAALADATARFAGGLAQAGIRREARVALLLHDTVDFPIAFWGALRAGVIPVPVNTMLPAAQLGQILADCRAEALFVSPALLPVVQPVWPGPAIAAPFEAFLTAPPRPAPVAASADEVAFWLYSSGSTGAPKGTRHVHGSLRATAEAYGAQVLGIRPDDVVFSAAKLFFAYGLGNAMTFPMSVGACAVLLPDRPTPEAVLGMIARHQPTIFGGVPTLYASLLAQPGLGAGAGSARLRRCISAGEALPEPVGAAWSARVGVDILDGIGSTEMLHIFLSNRAGEVRYGSSGRAVPGYQLAIVDEAGAAVADGQIGELLVRGPSAAEGYWNQRDKSRATFRGEWTHTGDKYLRDADGFYHYQGRADDMFKVGGIWVSPFEVEAALLAHPAVAEAAVVAHADAEGLLKPKAFLVLRPDATAGPALTASLQAHVKARIGPWKYPRWVEVIDSLPKTATGKIQRYRLRA